MHSNNDTSLLAIQAANSFLPYTTRSEDRWKLLEEALQHLDRQSEASRNRSTRRLLVICTSNVSHVVMSSLSNGGAEIV
jgi:hypothetical protein